MGFSKSEYNATSKTKITKVERNSAYGYAQDKIELSDKWTITPALKYSWNDFFSRSSESRTDGTDTYSMVDDSATTNFNYSLYSNYQIDDSSDFYASWVPIFRPISNSDFDRTALEKLKDEKGNSWTIGYNKNFSDIFWTWHLP